MSLNLILLLGMKMVVSQKLSSLPTDFFCCSIDVIGKVMLDSFQEIVPLHSFGAQFFELCKSGSVMGFMIH